MIEILKADKVILLIFQMKDLIPLENIKTYFESFSDDLYQPLTVDIPMKHSQYNIVKHKEYTYLIYNTLFNSMITLSDKEFKQYEQISFDDLTLVGALVDNGFILPDYSDEFNRYEYYGDALQQQFVTPAHYTIVLTTKCNAML